MLWDRTPSAWIAPIQGIQVVWGHDRSREYRQKWQEQEPNDDMYIGRTCQVPIAPCTYHNTVVQECVGSRQSAYRGQRIWLRLVVIDLFQTRKKQCVHVFWWFYKPVFLTVGRHFLTFLWLRFSLVVFILTEKLWSLEHKIRLIWVLHEPWPTCLTLKCSLYQWGETLRTLFSLTFLVPSVKGYKSLYLFTSRSKLIACVRTELQGSSSSCSIASLR